MKIRSVCYSFFILIFFVDYNALAQKESPAVPLPNHFEPIKETFVLNKK
jgi:hypothetical protein